jgi:hypothetical protein
MSAHLDERRAAITARLRELDDQCSTFGRQYQDGELTKDGFVGAMNPILEERERLLEQARLSLPSVGTRLGRALVPLVMFPLAGVPVIAGIALESWIVASIFGWEFAVVLAVQLVPLAIFALPAWVIAVVQVFRTGEIES